MPHAMDALLLLLTIAFCFSTCIPRLSGNSIERHILVNEWERYNPKARKSLLFCFGDEINYNTRFGRLQDTSTGQGSFFTHYFETIPYTHIVIEMLDGENKNKYPFGGFYCEQKLNDRSYNITALKLPPLEEETISPEVSQIRATVGEEVVISMNVKQNKQLHVRWRHNGNPLHHMNNLLELKINAVNESDAGFYECFHEGIHDSDTHAITRLIVKRCEEGKFGPECKKTCNVCYNGGMCHEDTGLCICPPGFSGDVCEKACGPNRFGENCSMKCKLSASSQDNSCKDFKFCLLDPFGCSCGSGFNGTLCNEGCHAGRYGADCSEICHCEGGPDNCDPVTGACLRGCEAGWQGDSCQAPVCPNGTFGPACRWKCHCAEGISACHPVTGQCNGSCQLGYMGPICQQGTFNHDLQFVYMNANTSATNYTDDSYLTCLGFREPPSPQQLHSVFASSKVNNNGVLSTSKRSLMKPSSMKISKNVQTLVAGPYFCEETLNGEKTQISIINPHPATPDDIKPVRQYITARIGDIVKLELSTGSTLPLNIQWKHDRQLMTSWEGNLTVSLIITSSSDQGFYECIYKDGYNTFSEFYKLTVIECPLDTFGDGCQEDCGPCYNGGFCHQHDGTCICPVAFGGAHCERACDANYFGYNCEHQCSNSSDNPSCKGVLFCLPDPYGCTCASGFKGFQCMQECEPNTYGADCLQTCHCKNGPGACNSVTGACENDECEPGWIGSSCQIKVCPVGKYGQTCYYDCHCLDGPLACNTTSGQCTGKCMPGYTGTSCKQKCSAGKFGQNCQDICHCLNGSSACDPVNGTCKGGCEIGYSGDDCQQGEIDFFLTVQTNNGFIQETVSTLLFCHPTKASDHDIMFVREIDTGQGTDLPNNTRQYYHPLPHNFLSLYLEEENKFSRVGAYTCEQHVNNYTSIYVTALKTSIQAEVKPSKYYIRQYVNETIVLNVSILNKKQDLPLLWIVNGKERHEWENRTEVIIPKASDSDNGIYESFIKGRRHLGLHAIIKVIVIGCGPDKWGIDCENDCPPCYNGGLCHPDAGVCLCPHGFNGTFCENACSPGYFGKSCEKQCNYDSKVIDEDDCGTFLFCLPDPLGCMCGSGFRGPGCEEDCEIGTYGASCTQKCHCKQDGDHCNRITGKCDKGCQSGWLGESCQILAKNAEEYHNLSGLQFECPHGRFGFPECDQPCHCALGNTCDSETGICPFGCDQGWFGESCSKCRPGLFGNQCQNTCHCKAGDDVCNSTTGICDDGECSSGYIGENCQSECPVNTYGQNCSLPCECMNGGRCDHINGSCECVGKWQGNVCEEFAPEIVSVNDMEMNTGIETTAYCIVAGKPLPAVQIWSFDLPGLKTNVKPLNDSVQEAVSSFEQDLPKKFAVNCTASNIHGKEEKMFTVLAIAPPYLKKPPIILSLTSEEVELSWNPWEFGKDGGGNANDSVLYQVLYRVQGQEWIVLNNWTTTVGIKISGLYPNTAFEFAVKCQRDGIGGEGPIIETVSKRTPCKFPNPLEILPNNFYQKDVSVDHVDLIWEKPNSIIFNCAIQKYILKFWINGNFTTMQEHDLPAHIDHYSHHSLSSNTSYIFQLSLIAENKTVGNPANISVFTSLPTLGPVENLHIIYSNDSTKIKLNWDAPAKANVVDCYIIQIILLQQMICTETSNNVTQIEVFDMKVEIDDLKPFSSYEIVVQPKALSGFGETKHIDLNTTEAAPAAPPSNVRISLVAKDLIQYAWDDVPCTEANGIIKEYEYAVKKHSHLIQKRSLSSWHIPPTKVKDKEITLNNLDSHQEYEFVVRALTDAGEGPWSEPLRQRTKEDVPSKPTLEEISVTSTNITVKIYQPDLINGVLLKYQLNYNSSIENKTIFIDSNETKPFNYTIIKLRPGTKYFLQVIAKTNAGWGMTSDVISSVTEEDIPSPPQDLNLVNNEETILEVEWQKPLLPNGLILGYEVECNLVSFSTTNTTRKKNYKLTLNNTFTVYKFTNLVPDSEYEVKIRAYNSKGNSLPISEMFQTKITTPSNTPLNTPKPPEIVEVQLDNLIIVAKIFPAAESSYQIKAYQVIVEDSTNNNEVIDPDKCTDYDSAVKYSIFFYIAAEIPDTNISNDGYLFHVGDNKTYGHFLNGKLENTTYRIHVRAIGYREGLYSSFSESKEIDFKSQDVKILGSEKQEKIEGCTILDIPCLWFLVIIILITICIFALLIFIILYTRRRKRRGSHKISQLGVETRSVQTSVSSRKSRNTHSSSHTCSVSYHVSTSDEKDNENGKIIYETNPLLDAKLSAFRNSKFKSRVITMGGAIPIQFLSEYIETKATHPVYNFHHEFRQLFSGQTATWSVAKKSENMKKNRYGNILPYDHTRVVLQPLVHVPHSDYINASYIDGYDRRKAYIASQGPKENFFMDFWRMIWQENTTSIVMVTNLVENGRVKCDQYWPNDNCLYGDIHVMFCSLEKTISFVIRTFQLTKISTDEKRVVKQFQILEWPDQQAPMYASSVIALCYCLREETSVSSGPVVVHCSAGVGRTGTFIAIDALLQQACEEEEVNVFEYVNKIRLQRYNMVQTLEQYVFVYEALFEAIECGETKVLANRIANYFQELCRDSEVEPSGLLEQYLKLQKVSRKQNWQQSSTYFYSTNVQKNRSLSILPGDQSICLRKMESSDDINAVFCDGFRHNNQYLVTQTPLLHTINNFWEMVYEYKSSVIVMLDSISHTRNSLKFGDYWSLEGSKLYGQLEVDVVTFQKKGPFIEQHMKLINTALDDAEPQRIVQLQFREWPTENTLPASLSSLISLLQQVEVWHRKLGGPITVHCMNGASHSGLFCIASNLSEQLRCEGAVDILQIVRHFRYKQPSAISNMEQYKFCYEIAIELAKVLE